MLDYLIVGSGLYGTVMAYELAARGKKVKILERRDHIGGNCYTENVGGIHVHRYGPHYFNTNKMNVWRYVNNFVDFYTSLPRVKVNYEGKLYSFPINLLTLHQMYGVKTPAEAEELIKKLRKDVPNPANFEQFVISQVGFQLYQTFYEGYTIKQWGRHPRELPASIAKRIPIRTTMDDTYHGSSQFQGVPLKGYTELFEVMLDGIDVELNADFFAHKAGWWRHHAKHLIYSGCVDAFFDYRFGRLDYRSLRHESHTHQNCDFQGTAQVNYTSKDVPYTRIIEHKHIQYEGHRIPDTIVTYEYPQEFDGKNEPFYPINDQTNEKMFGQYQELMRETTDVTFGGRLGTYKYLDMDDVIQMALIHSARLLNG
jgi:UDP-galactopyranose mutase